MRVETIGEYGYWQALMGLGLSYGLTSSLLYPIYDKQLADKLANISRSLCNKDEGHNKFLESIVVWLDVTAPRFWWQQFDTYRVGVTKQSESTMHTIMRDPLTKDNFSRAISIQTLDRLNGLIADGLFNQLKAELPEGFMQRRIVCINYRVLRRIIVQRTGHELHEWAEFTEAVVQQVEHPELLR